MGILAQLEKNDISKRLGAEKIDQGHGQPNSADTRPPNPPAAACHCGSLQFWLDAYGQWHCAECEPLPAALVTIRDVHTIDPGAKSWIDPATGKTWLCLPDRAGRMGWEPAGLPVWKRWWARFEFNDLPTLQHFGT